jgi:chemotaxis signal transduction protein
MHAQSNSALPDAPAPESQAPAWQVLERAGRKYAISLIAGTELLERVRPAAIPLPPVGVVGLVSWKGEPVILGDLQLLLGGTRSHVSTRALVIGQGSQAMALAIDGLPNIVRAQTVAKPAADSAWLTGPLRQCISEWIEVGGSRTVPVLEPYKLMECLTQAAL